MKPPINCTVKITRSPYFPLWFAVLSTLSRQSRRPRFWTVSPGLQIRVWHLPDNCWSLPFLRRLALKFHLFCIVWLILMLTSNVFSLIPVCHCNWYGVMWLVGSKPIRSNVTMTTTSFLHILCHRKFVTNRVNGYFFTQITSYAMRNDIIFHPFPISSQYLKMWGVNSPGFELVVSYLLVAKICC